MPFRLHCHLYSFHCYSFIFISLLFAIFATAWHCLMFSLQSTIIHWDFSEELLPKQLIHILHSCSLLFLLICHFSVLTLQFHPVPPDPFSDFSRLFWTQKALQSFSLSVFYKFKEHYMYCTTQVTVWWEPSHNSTEPHSVYRSVLILLHTTKNYSQKLFFQPVLPLPNSIFI